MILNSKKYNEQHNFPRSFTKNKLFELTKESKSFKLQQTLRVEFNKND